jgi:hypothetical protein
LLREQEGVAAQILMLLGADLEDARAEVGRQAAAAAGWRTWSVSPAGSSRTGRSTGCRSWPTRCRTPGATAVTCWPTCGPTGRTSAGAGRWTWCSGRGRLGPRHRQVVRGRRTS